MKCKSCGKEIANNAKICDNCGFNIEEFNKRKIVTIKEDPIVPKSQQTSLIDNPILTFVCGLLSVIFSFLFIFSPDIVIFYLLLVILSIFLVFYLSNKPAKVKLIPLIKIGKIFAYFSISIILFKVVYSLLGTLFF